MIKILHLHTQLDLTCGISKTIYLLLKNLGDEFNQTVFTFGGDAIKKFNTTDAKVIVANRLSKNFFYTLLIFLRLLSLIKKEKFDIIHSHHRYFDLIAFFVSKVTRVRTVTSVQSKVRGKKILSYKADVLIACSYSIKRHLVDYFGVNEGRIKVIYNFIDLNEFKEFRDRAELKMNLRIDQDNFVIGYFGRINIAEKGVDILLDTFRNLSKNHTKLTLLMVGDGDNLDFVEKFIYTNKLNILLLPAQEGVYSYINMVDVVVMPSRVEPFGIVAIESGILKKPVVSSGIEGLSEIIEVGVSGLTFDILKPNTLADMLESLINNPSLRQELGNNLFNRVMNNFTLMQSIPRYRKIYCKNLS